MSNHPFQPEHFDKALKEQLFPNIESQLTQHFGQVVAHIHHENLLDSLVIALMERRTPIIAAAVTSVLMMNPESLALRALNQTVDVTALLYRSTDAEASFAKECGRKLYDELNQHVKDASDASLRDYLTRLLYRTLFQKDPRSREWIKENFLTYDPLGSSGGGASLGYVDHHMLVILNFIGLDNQLIRERARQVLDIQMAHDTADHRMIALLSQQPEFDMEYLVKIAKILGRPEDEFNKVKPTAPAILSALGDLLVQNGKFDQGDEIAACINGLHGTPLETRLIKVSETALVKTTAADLLLDFIEKTRNSCSERLKVLYQRNMLTAEQIGSRLRSTRDLNFAVKYSAFPVAELLEHAPESLREQKLGTDLGL